MLIRVSNLFQINLDSSKGLYRESFPMLLRMINHFFFWGGVINGGTYLNQIMTKSTSLILHRAWCYMVKMFRGLLSGFFPYGIIVQ